MFGKWCFCHGPNPRAVEASFMMMNQAILMMPKAQVIDSRLIQDFKIKHQKSNPRFKIQEKKSRRNKSRLHIG